MVPRENGQSHESQCTGISRPSLVVGACVSSSARRLILLDSAALVLASSCVVLLMRSLLLMQSSLCSKMGFCVLCLHINLSFCIFFLANLLRIWYAAILRKWDTQRVQWDSSNGEIAVAHHKTEHTRALLAYHCSVRDFSKFKTEGPDGPGRLSLLE